MPLMSLVTDSLSDEGRRVMVSGFQQSMAAEKIAQAIKDATGRGGRGADGGAARGRMAERVGAAGSRRGSGWRIW